MAAGKHEAARGDAERADGVEAHAGEFVASDIPGDDSVRTDEPAGEFVSSDIPGDVRPDGGDQAEGEYVESDVPGDAEPTSHGEPTGEYTDRNQ